MLCKCDILISHLSNSFVFLMINALKNYAYILLFDTGESKPSISFIALIYKVYQYTRWELPL